MEGLLKDIESMGKMRGDRGKRKDIMDSDLTPLEKNTQLDALWKDTVKRERKHAKCTIALKESSAKKLFFDDAVKESMAKSSKNGKEHSFWYDLKSENVVSPIIRGECGVSVNFTTVIDDSRKSWLGFFHTHPDNLGVFDCGPAGMDFVTFSRNKNVGELVVGCPDINKITTVDISNMDRFERKEWGLKIDKLDNDLSDLALDRMAFKEIIDEHENDDPDDEFTLHTSQGYSKASVNDARKRILPYLDGKIDEMQEQYRKIVTDFKKEGHAYNTKIFK